METYYPIVIFCYNRPNHLKKMLESIQRNAESIHTKAYFFIDGAKNDRDKVEISKILEIINSSNIFKENIIIKRDSNFGMQKNVISGISHVLRENDAAIILEDDLKFSKYYLNFMNKALKFYKPYENVWQINAWSYPNYISFSKKTKISNQMSSWGMGVYKDKWEFFAKDELKLTNKIDKKDAAYKKKFNFENGYPWIREMEMNVEGTISTFSCFWYQCIFINNGVTVFPGKSLVFNTGFDGSGIHSGARDVHGKKIFEGEIDNFKIPTSFNKLFKLNARIFYFIFSVKDYLNYHKTKISSFRNFFSFIKSKVK